MYFLVLWYKYVYVKNMEPLLFLIRNVKKEIRQIWKEYTISQVENSSQQTIHKIVRSISSNKIK